VTVSPPSLVPPWNRGEQMRQADVSRAIIEALEATGANSLLELGQMGEEAGQVLADKLKQHVPNPKVN
jgi:hypothetical protein